MSDLLSWLWLSECKGLTARSAVKYLQHFGGAKELYYAGEDALRQVEGATRSEVEALCRKDLRRAEKLEQQCREKEIRILCMQDAAYPERLRNLEDPPLVLYVRGQLPAVDDRLCVAVVGTRKASRYGLDTARRLSEDLAAQNAVVVTGLAEGVDSAAAKGALQAHGTVIGVLGTGVDVVYPAWNGSLQETVGKVGALVSEYPPGSKASKGSFPRRNRLISALSLGVAIVEAPERSGALITAARAQEQGKDVFVVPGKVDDPAYYGSHGLIRDGAVLIRSAADILEEYRFRYPDMLRENGRSRAGSERRPAQKMVDKPTGLGYIALEEQLDALTAQELKIVGLLAEGEQYADLIIRGAELPAGEVLAALTMLQLKGYVQEQNGLYRLVVSRRG